jgi:uncharacterized protein (TIGR03643 family)
MSFLCKNWRSPAWFCGVALDNTKKAAFFVYQCYSLENARPDRHALRKAPKSDMRPHRHGTQISQPLHPSPHTEAEVSRIIEMAWEDRTAFEAIEAQFGLNESAVVALMRLHMKPSSFRMWRKRAAGRITKHAVLHGAKFLRHRATHTRQ